MKYYSTIESAKILGYNDDAYIRRLIQMGKLEAVKIGNNWGISEETLHNIRLESAIKNKNKELVLLNNELRALADKCMQPFQLDSARKGAIHLFLGKSYKTHGAILVLASKGYGEDSAILARSLFESYINLKYMLDSDNDELATRYFAYDFVLQKTMLQDLMSEPNSKKEVLQREASPKPGDTSIRLIKENYDSAMKRFNFKKQYGWSGKSIEELASLAGRSRNYKTIYNLQCQLSHPSTRGMNDYFNRSQSDLIMNIGTSDNYVQESLVMAFDYFGSLLDISADFMSWKIQKELKGLLDRFEIAVKEINSNKASGDVST